MKAPNLPPFVKLTRNGENNDFSARINGYTYKKEGEYNFALPFIWIIYETKIVLLLIPAIYGT